MAIQRYTYLISLLDHAGNFTSGLREFGEFDPGSEANVPVGYDTVKHASYRSRTLC